MWGFQLWANLPASHKMMAPRYRDVKSNQIPEVITDTGALAKIICGEVNNTRGPVQDIVIEPEYLDITVPPKTHFRHPVGRGRTSLAYIIEGEGYFDPLHDSYAFEVVGENYFDLKRERLLGPEYLVAFDDGNEILVSTEEKSVRFLLV